MSLTQASSSDLRQDDTNGSSVLVLFVLVRPPLFHDDTSDTTNNKEQVLAAMVFTVGIRRWVPIPVGLLFPVTPSEPQTVSFHPAYANQVRNVRCCDPEHSSCLSLDVCFDSSFDGSDNSHPNATPGARKQRGCQRCTTLTFATLFAQSVITLRLVTTSGYLTPITYHTPRVYAVTGRNRWIASCLSFTTFVQVIFGTACVIYYALRPGMISFLALRSRILRQIQLENRWYFLTSLSKSTGPVTSNHGKPAK